MGESILPLELLRSGEWAEVADVVGEPGWVRRMAELGIRTGCRVLMLCSGSPCLLQLEGSRLCLRACADGTGDGWQIYVRPLLQPAA